MKSLGSDMNWFEGGGNLYAQFRPEYPPEVSVYLASQVAKRGVAVDVGCGNGQLTTQLSVHFEKVIGLDPSADQILNATAKANVQYFTAPAELLPLPDNSANLITAAQAAHWFDLPEFFREVRRVGVDQGVVALISYGVLTLDSAVDQRFQEFYWQEIGPFWPPERKLVDTGYADIPFPFAEIAAPKISMCKQWDYEELLGYIGTWSATKKLAAAGRTDVLTNFAEDLRLLWGDLSLKRSISWPMNMRIGTISKR